MKFLLQLFALDNWNGDIIWSMYVNNLSSLSGGKFMLFTQRTVAHFPHEPQCVVIGKNKVIYHDFTDIFIHLRMVYFYDKNFFDT